MTKKILCILLCCVLVFGAAEIGTFAGSREAYRQERGIFALPGACPVCGAPVTRGRGGTDDTMSVP